MVNHQNYITNLSYIHYNCIENSKMSREWICDNLTVAESECSVEERAKAMEFSLMEERMESNGIRWNEGEMTDYESAMHDFLKFGRLIFA